MDLKRYYKRGNAVRISLLNLFLLTGGFVARAEEGVETDIVITNTPPLKVDVRRDVEGSNIFYRYAFVTSGQEKFTFLIPEGYRVDTSDPAKVKLASPDFSCVIVLGIAGEFPAGTKMDDTALRARVLTNYTDTSIKGEQTVCANGQTAPAVDFTWKADSGVTRMTRTAFIPTTAGLMEFTLNASPEKFETSLHGLNLVMLTFRSSANGKFDYVIGSKYP